MVQQALVTAGIKAVGQPNKLTPEAMAELVARVRLGDFVSVAARAAGLKVDTVEKWLRRGRGLDPKLPPKPPYTTLVVALDQARARAERDVLINLFALTARDRRAAIYWLETFAPDRWGKDRTETPQIDHTLVAPAAYQQERVVVSIEDLSRLASGYRAERRRLLSGGMELEPDLETAAG